MDNHKRMFVSSVEDDIISNFDMINPILERLPIEDAVSTSVLSRKWRFRWNSMSELNFNNQFTKKFSVNGAFDSNGFVRIINHVMINHMGPIFKFHLHIPDIFLDSFQEVDIWMRIVSRNGVRELVIMNSNRAYPLPFCVFSCVELGMLRISNCIFKPPIGFKGFPSLENIFLQKIHFVGETVMINLPQVKELTLDRCSNVNNFNINAVNLRTLVVIGCPDAMLLRLLHSEHLEVVHICLLKSIEDFQQVERFSLSMILSKLPNIVSFTIDGYFLKFMAAEKFPKWLPGEVKHLKQLEFQSFSFGDLDQLQVLCSVYTSELT